MKRFTTVNEGFVCKHCRAQVPPATSTCRNHCTQCLYSLHVDIYPGDRACGCHGLMPPVQILVQGGEMTSILHQCQACGQQIKNKIAPDDDRESLFTIFQKKS